MYMSIYIHTYIYICTCLYIHTFNRHAAAPGRLSFAPAAAPPLFLSLSPFPLSSPQRILSCVHSQIFRECGRNSQKSALCLLYLVNFNVELTFENFYRTHRRLWKGGLARVWGGRA